MIERIWRMPYTATVGVVLGAAVSMAAPFIFGAVGEIYDEAFPVMDMRGELVELGPNYAVLHITGQKLRGTECRLRAIYGMSVDVDGMRRATIARRVEEVPFGMAFGAGRYDLGNWLVKPVHDDAVSIEVYSEHSCPGRVMRSKLADVELR